VTPRLMRKRWLLPSRRAHRYHQIRCAICYRRMWPWQAQIRGANYFPHPYMQCHVQCGLDKERELRGARGAA